MAISCLKTTFSSFWFERRLEILLHRPARSVISEDIRGLDLSFQLDRRMSELFLTMWAQKMGIDVYHGVDIGFEIAEDDAFDTPTCHHKKAIAGPGLKSWRATGSSKLPRVVLKYSSQSTGTHVNTKPVCDATGFQGG
jgi:hypothetical protein